MSLHKSILLFVFSINLFGGLWGLDPQKKITQYTLNTWKTERGLPNNTVLAIAQDRSGYLWLGTADGLVRFDGVNFSLTNFENNAAFLDHFVNNLYITCKGVLWIGTLRGQLLSLEQGRFKRHLLSPTVSNISSNCLIEDDQGTLWVGSSEGLFYCSPGNKGLFKKYLAFPYVKILCLVKDHLGHLLISTEKKGLFRLEKDKLRKVLSDTDKLGSDINVFSQDRNGCLWLGTDSGLYQYQNDRLLHYPLKSGIPDNIISLAEDRDGNLWVGSEGGLHRWRNGVFQSLATEQGLSSNYIYSIYEDAEGTLWVGTVEGGLTQLRDEKITVFGEAEGLSSDLVRCIHGGEAGILWISGYGGYLSRLQGNHFENFRPSELLKNDTVWQLEAETDGSVWLGTDHGLYHFQNNHFQTVALPPAIASADIRCVFKDRSGRLWIGSWGAGLLCRSDGKFIVYSTSDGFSDKQVNVIHEDRQGNIWVGGESGVSIAQQKKNGAFNFKNILSGCRAVAFYEDVHSAMW
ncbi:MAG: hypothetical protein KKG79_07770, partial [Acidobacteria bacterium]|nr:hypothetical protein [Acidobacteriota bacterium]